MSYAFERVIEGDREAVNGEQFYNQDFTAWLFCLSGDDYEKRCGMVDGFMEGGK